MTKIKKLNGWLYTTIAAIVLFALGVLLATLYLNRIRPINGNDYENDNVQFSMYNWNYGVINDSIMVADVCGINDSYDEAFLHLRKPIKGGWDSELWLKPGDGLKWCRGYERITYSVKFSTVDQTESFSSACTCVNNENGNVLKVDYPSKIIDFVCVTDSFQLVILHKGKIYDTYHFSVAKPFAWKH